MWPVFPDYLSILMTMDLFRVPVNGVVLCFTQFLHLLTVIKDTLQIIETKKYKMTNRTFSIGIIHLNGQKQFSTEETKKRRFNDAEGIQAGIQGYK